MHLALTLGHLRHKVWGGTLRKSVLQFCPLLLPVLVVTKSTRGSNFAFFHFGARMNQRAKMSDCRQSSMSKYVVLECSARPVGLKSRRLSLTKPLQGWPQIKAYAVRRWGKCWVFKINPNSDSESHSLETQITSTEIRSYSNCSNI